MVGSGPGGLQVGYFLSHLGVRHAHISADPSPGGMFRRFPIFQRLLSWTRPYAPYERATRYYESFDWNSLLAEEPANRSLMRWEAMDSVPPPQAATFASDRRSVFSIPPPASCLPHSCRAI